MLWFYIHAISTISYVNHLTYLFIVYVCEFVTFFIATVVLVNLKFLIIIIFFK